MKSSRRRDRDIKKKWKPNKMTSRDFDSDKNNNVGLDE